MKNISEADITNLLIADAVFLILLVLIKKLKVKPYRNTILRLRFGVRAMP
jgi:F0F1-type ATP synthase membrane subunit b/b'